MTDMTGSGRSYAIRGKGTRRANTSQRLAADSPMPVTPPSTLQVPHSSSLTPPDSLSPTSLESQTLATAEAVYSTSTREKNHEIEDQKFMGVWCDTRLNCNDFGPLLLAVLLVVENRWKSVAKKTTDMCGKWLLETVGNFVRNLWRDCSVKIVGNLWQKKPRICVENGYRNCGKFVKNLWEIKPTDYRQ
ncbi:hypothetical protein Tco_1009804 [Tanacetum coccineum]